MKIVDKTKGKKHVAMHEIEVGQTFQQVDVPNVLYLRILDPGHLMRDEKSFPCVCLTYNTLCWFSNSDTEYILHETIVNTQEK